MNSQLHVRGTATAEDRAGVERILVAAAEAFGMLDTTVTSRVADTLRCYTETWAGGVAVGARVAGGMVVVDLYPGAEPSPRFAAVAERITGELRREFGGRLHVAAAGEFILWHSTLPVSEAAHEFYRRQLSQLRKT